MYGILNAIASFVKGLVGQMAGYILLKDMAENLATWSDASGSCDGLYTLVTGVYEAIVPFALALSFGFAILEILSTLTRQGPENVTISAIVFPLIKMVCTWYLIYNGLTIVGYLMGGSDWFVAKVDEANTTAAIASVNNGATVDPAGFLAKLVINFSIGMLSTLACAIAGVLLGLQIISVKIEFLIRAMFMPLALCSISNGGAHSAGMRYFKKMIGSMFILGGVIAAICIVQYIGEGMMQSFFNAMENDETFGASLLDGIPNFFAGAFFSALIGPFTCVSCVSIVKAAINDAFS